MSILFMKIMGLLALLIIFSLCISSTPQETQSPTTTPAPTTTTSPTTTATPADEE
jgi:hypothetical protein